MGECASPNDVHVPHGKETGLCSSSMQIRQEAMTSVGERIPEDFGKCKVECRQFKKGEKQVIWVPL